MNDLSVIMVNKKTIIWIIIIGVIIGFIPVMPIVVSFCAAVGLIVFIWPCIFLCKNYIELVDFPFFTLFIGTFVFGRAFSVLGLQSWGVPVFVTELTIITISGLVILRGRVDNFIQYLPDSLKMGLFVYLLYGTFYLVFGLYTNGALALRDIVFCYYTIFLFIVMMVFKTQEKLKMLLIIISPCAVLSLLFGVSIILKFIASDSFVGKYLLQVKTFNLSFYYGLIIIFGLSYISYAKRYRVAVGILIGMAVFLNILLQVRAGWVATIVATVFLCLIDRCKFSVFIKKYITFCFLLIIIAIIILGLFCPDIMSAVRQRWYGLWHWNTSTAEGSNVVWRFSIWKQIINKIIDHPLLGWGFGAHPKFLIWGYNLPDIAGIGPGSGIVPAHNHILAVTFKMGLVGLMLFLFINVKILFYGLRYVKLCKSDFNRRFLIASLGCVIYWHVMALFFDIIDSPPTSIFLWILLGLVLSVVHVDKVDV